MNLIRVIAPSRPAASASMSEPMSASVHRIGVVTSLCLGLLAPVAVAQNSIWSIVGETRSPDDDPIVRILTIAPDELAGPSETECGGFDPRAAVDFYSAGVSPEADSHADAAFLPDGTGVVVANRESKNLTIFDPLTRALLKSIPLSGSPESVAVSPDGTRAVTANLLEDTASIVDLLAGVEIAAVSVGDGPSAALIAASGDLAVISSSGSRTGHVIDLTTNAQIRNFTTGGVFTQISVNPETAAYAFKAFGPALAGRTLVFPDSLAERILLIDIDTGATTTLPSTIDPIGVAVAPGAGVAVVTHFGSSKILTVVDLATKTIAKTINCGADLQGPVAINPSGTRAVVSVLNACRVVDLGTNAFTSDLPTASVNELLTTADGLHAVCVGFRGSLISYGTQTLVKDLNNFVSTSVGAVSPTAPIAAQFSDTFGEDMVVMNTNGSGGSLISAGPSGPAPEADRARTAAVTPDSKTAVVVSQQSQSATILDPYTGIIAAVAPTGRRPGEVRVTPDGGKAVVSNKDGTTLTIIDLAAGTTVEVPISTRADQIQISPDSAFAYAAVVVSDGVWRVNLANNAVQGPKLTTGNMGGVGYSYSQTSGMALSHSGATLVTCNSFDNTISIIDTASWSVVKTVSVTNFPTYASFSPDDSKIYVTSRDADTLGTDRVTVVSNAGAASAVTGTAIVGSGGTSDFPFISLPSAAGDKLYVLLWSSNRIAVVNTATNVQIATIPLPASTNADAMRLSPDGARLYVTSGSASLTFGAGTYFRSQSGVVSIIDTATDAIVESIPTTFASSSLGLAANGNAAAVPQPWGDGVTILDFVDCPPDFDRSGFLDTDDFDAFVRAFEEGDPSTDFDGTGFVDTDDFDAFVRAFEEGC